MTGAAAKQALEAVDPATRLTPAERAFVEQLNKTMTRDQILAALQTNLQVAIEVELATIPIYLFTYYSIQRDAASGEGIDRAQAFANKAGAILMSVAVEEMLHMSLSANVMYAMGWAPQLYGRAPTAYPASLPGHNPVGPRGPNGETAELIPLSSFSFAQLWHFLQIEYPEALDAPPQDSNWDTIGQLYSYVRCLLRTDCLSDADFQRGAAASAIQPYNYSPNNIDTYYPTGKFDPWKPAPPAARPAWSDGYAGAAGGSVPTNRADSHAGASQLLCIRTREDALLAIDTICDQGEGYGVPNLGAGRWDDPSKTEESHYYKFLTLQAQFAAYPTTQETLCTQPTPPAPQLPAITDAMLAAQQLVIPFPDNPTTASYPAEFQPFAAFCSACFQYMLILTETVFRVPPAGQKLFFNEGLHRSMIWVLDKYIRTLREVPLPDGTFMGPVFENVDLGARADSYDGLRKYALAAVDAAQALAKPLPQNDPLASVYSNIAYYAALATGEPANLVSGARPLVDVRRYWS